MSDFKSIVITGGPCAGKTTGIVSIEENLSKLGYQVLIVPETASELILNGITPQNVGGLEFQYILFEKQLHKQMLYEKAADIMKAKKGVIIYDRGLLDNKSYMSRQDFIKMLMDFNITEIEARNMYDAVIHLVSAANGAEKFYTLSNNLARSETIEEARRLDIQGMNNWTGHPHLRIVSNKMNFEEKINRLLQEVYMVLGEPIPLDIQKKYLIKRPDLKILEKFVNFEIIDILQYYLISLNPKEEIRIRQWGQDNNYMYYYSKKTSINDKQRIETKRHITLKEFTNYLKDIDTKIPVLKKKRICFIYEYQYFEIDIFEFSSELELLEIKFTNMSTDIRLPEFVEVIKDVTDDENYRNYNLASSRKL